MKQQAPRRRGQVLRTVGTFTLGAAVGSLIALLYAPASGKVMRQRLANQARRLRQAAVRRIGQTQRVLVQRAERMREAATGMFLRHQAHTNGRHPIRHRTAHHAHAN